MRYVVAHKKKNAMRYISLISIVFTLISCTIQNSKMNNVIATNEIDSITKRIDQKLFKYNEIKTFDKFDWDAKGFERLTDTILLNKWFNQSHFFNMYKISMFSVQKRIGNLIPMTFIQTGDDYGAIVMKLVDSRNGKVIGTMELSGGQCGGPSDLDNGGFELCDNRSSYFDSDSTFRHNLVHFYCDSLTDNSELRIDTIKYFVTICIDKGFRIKQIDSIRTVTMMKNYGR